MIRRWFKLLVCTAALMSLTGCKHSEFNAIAHMRDIVVCSRAADYQNMRSYLLEHATEEIGAQLDQLLSGDIVDPEYRVSENGVWVEQYENTVELLGEYTVKTTYLSYYVVVKFTYVDETLVDYHISRIDSDELTVRLA